MHFYSTNEMDKTINWVKYKREIETSTITTNGVGNEQLKPEKVNSENDWNNGKNLLIY